MGCPYVQRGHAAREGIVRKQATEFRGRPIRAFRLRHRSTQRGNRRPLLRVRFRQGPAPYGPAFPPRGIVPVMPANGRYARCASRSRPFPQLPQRGLVPAPHHLRTDDHPDVLFRQRPGRARRPADQAAGIRRGPDRRGSRIDDDEVQRAGRMLKVDQRFGRQEGVEMESHRRLQVRFHLLHGPGHLCRIQRILFHLPDPAPVPVSVFGHFHRQQAAFDGLHHLLPAVLGVLAASRGPVLQLQRVQSLAGPEYLRHAPHIVEAPRPGVGQQVQGLRVADVQDGPEARVRRGADHFFHPVRLVFRGQLVSQIETVPEDDELKSAGLELGEVVAPPVRAVELVIVRESLQS